MSTPEFDNMASVLDRRTLVWERRLAVDVRKLWGAIATQEGLGHWFMPTRHQVEEGGPFSFEGGWDGTITRIEPPRLIEFTPADGPDGYLRFAIVDEGNGVCLFRLTDRMGDLADAGALFPDAPEHQVYQPGGAGTHWSGVVAGYHGFVDALESWLTGVRKPFDHDQMSRRYMAVLDGWFG